MFYNWQKAFNSSENWCGKSERSIEWQHLTGSPSGPNSNLAWDTERPPRATSSLTCYLGKKPPNPQSSTELWILGHQGLVPRAYPRYTPEPVAEACQSVVVKYCICDFWIVYNRMRVRTPIEKNSHGHVKATSMRLYDVKTVWKDVMKATQTSLWDTIIQCPSKLPFHKS